MKKVLVAAFAVALVAPAAFAADLASDANFKAKCAMCHGANAEGKPAMKIAPLKTAAGKPAAELTDIITKGAKGPPPMPAFEGKLTPAQVSTLAAEIKALK
jgi:mono/diheme cytochrome c family protein